AVYVFVNGELVQEDTDLGGIRRDVVVDLIFIQASESGGFTESAIDKFTATSADFLNLGADPDTLTSTYNAQLLDAMRTFKRTFEALAARFPKLRITYNYATKGDKPHPNVERKATRLKSQVLEMFSAAEVDVRFLGARTLLEMARTAPASSHALRLSENP